jgi:amino acid adenylation domain-containing protein
MSASLIESVEAFRIFGQEEVEQSIVERFEEMAVLFADRIAVSSQLVNLTYAAINHAANRVAYRLIDAGSDPDMPVALLLDQGAPLVIATLGVLKAGRFYVPLDPANPTQRNRHMLDDAGAKTLITHTYHLTVASALSDGGLDILNIDEIDVNVFDRNPNLSIAPSSLAYVLYTSGSTGNPKGVMHSHRNVLHNVMRHTNSYRICPDDRQSLLYTASVYGGQRDMYNALLNGAALYVYGIKKEGIQGLARWLDTNRVSIYCSVATIFRQFIETLDVSQRMNHIRLLKLGGEATYSREVDAFKHFFSPDCVMHCGLGSTETGLVRNFFINKSTVISGNTVPLGYPVDDLEVLLLNEAGQTVADEECGEIAIKSRYISLGYWRNTELTNKVFSTDSQSRDVRIYRTGDLGIIHPDGCLEHRGRRDFQIKIRGNRVEVPEIEMALTKLEAVKEAAVIGWKSPQGIDKLIAYLVASGSSKPSTKYLHKSLGAMLPDHMVPSYFLWLDAFPLLPNGKLDRNALPRPDSTPTMLEQSFVEAGTPVEKKLVEIWSAILGVVSIGIHDSFFELGGDSLSAVMLFARIDKVFGINLPMSTLVERPTITKLAPLLARRAARIEWSTIVPVKLTGDRPPLFCVHGVFGEQFFLRSLGGTLNQDRPLYALQSRRLDGKYFGFKTVEDIATIYLAEIRLVQPLGPYFLSGYSFGGNVALEIARQLKVAGEIVALLVLFDTNPPGRADVPAQGFLNALLGMPVDILDFSAKAILSRNKLGFRTRYRVVSRTMMSALKYIQSQVLHISLKVGWTLPVLMRDEYVGWNHYRLSLAYRPQSYAGDVTVFYTAKKKVRIEAEWKEFVSGTLTTYPLQGEHDTFFKMPHVQVLAAQLNRLLNES